MSDKTDDEELAEALEEHVIPVKEPAQPPPKVAPPVEATEEPEKPEDKLNLALNPDEFVLDVPPREGI